MVHSESGRRSGEEREKKELRMDVNVGAMPGNCLNYDNVNIIANYKLRVI